MKAKVLVGFTDLKESVYRKEGEIFDVEKERFIEINQTIIGCLEEVKAASKKKAMKDDD